MKTHTASKYPTPILHCETIDLRAGAAETATPRKAAYLLVFGDSKLRASTYLHLYPCKYILTCMDTEKDVCCSESVGTHERILAAAKHCFVNKGIDGSTTREIAKQADVNEVTLFRHFGNKNGLVLAVLKAYSPMGSIRSKLAGLIQYKDLRDDLIHIAETIANSWSEHADLMKICLSHATQIPELRDVMLAHRQEGFSIVSSYLTQMQQRGKLRDDADPMLLTPLFIAPYALTNIMNTFLGNQFSQALPLELMRPVHVDTFVRAWGVNSDITQTSSTDQGETTKAADSTKGPN